MALGTMGWVPSERRETSCYAIARGGRLFVFDCGTGARRLGNQELAPAVSKASEIFIALSHYHLDHVIGLTYLPEILKGRKVTIAGPAKSITGISLRDALERLTARPLYSLPIDKFPMDLELVELELGENKFGDFSIVARPQGHSDPSIGMRLDDLFTYVTDTACDEGTAELARGTAMLLHECWLDDEGYKEAAASPDGGLLKTHSWVSGVTEIAAEAGVEFLALGHLNPAYREGRLRRMEQAARWLFPGAVMLHDFQQFTLDE